MIPNAISTATYFGTPDRQFATSRCGRFAPVDYDAALIFLAQTMGCPRLAVWLIFEERSRDEAVTYIRNWH